MSTLNFDENDVIIPLKGKEKHKVKCYVCGIVLNRIMSTRKAICLDCKMKKARNYQRQRKLKNNPPKVVN